MRRVLWFVTVASASYVVIVVLGTTDYGGDAYGLRRFVGIEMLMCLSLGAIWNELQSRRTERYAFLVILGLSLTSAGLGVRDPLVSGPFPLRDAIPILFAYAQGHAALAAIHVVLIGAFAITAFLRVRAALYTSECSPAAAGVTSAVR